MSSYGQKVTKRGRELISACAVAERPLELTKICVGKGDPGETDLSEMTALASYVADAEIGARWKDGANFFFNLQYDNSKHPDVETFLLSEFMLYAKDLDTEEDVPLVYGYLGDYRELVVQYKEGSAPRTNTYRITIILTDALAVNVTASAGAPVEDDIEAIQRIAERAAGFAGEAKASETAAKEASEAAKNAQTGAETAYQETVDAQEAAKGELDQTLSDAETQMEEQMKTASDEMGELLEAATTAKDESQKSAAEAAASANKAQLYSGKPAIVGENNHWWIWNADLGDAGEYVDTGKRAILAYDISYKSVDEMLADEENQPLNTVAIIASDVNVEDNAKLYIMRDDGHWGYLADLSGFPGNGILDWVKTAGDGSPGSYDTYTVYWTDGREYTYQVWNGANGAGNGDMLSVVYDPENKAQDIFAYVDDNVKDLNEAIEKKQDALSGESGQVVGFNSEGKSTPVNVGGRNYVVGSKADYTLKGFAPNASTMGDIKTASTEISETLFGSEITVSCDFDCNITDTGKVSFNVQDTWDNVFTFTSEQNGNGHVQKTVKLKALNPDTVNSLQDGKILYLQGTFTGSVTVRNIKLERGSVATDWSPAPEDTGGSGGSSWESKTTTFNSDGSITESAGKNKTETVFNSDGSITDKLYVDGKLTATKTTYFEGETIREVVS